MKSFLFTLPIVFFGINCSTEEKPEKDFKPIKNKLIPLHVKMPEPNPGDWLSYHKEKNLTFEQYKRQKPVRADEKRNKIYVQPIGDFDQNELKLISTTAEYLETFYGLKTVILPTKHDSVVPEKNRRHSTIINWNEHFTAIVSETDVVQLQTEYILNTILKPTLPADAAVMIALCDLDLYPNESYNFVFGQAQLKNRVGVWSFARFGNPSDPNEYNTVLLRTLKTASHETGHMFSIKHCSRYLCIMNGSNHLEESDRKPTWLCPDCLEKFCWNFSVEPKIHFENLQFFWKNHMFSKEANGYEKFIKAIAP